MGRALPSFCSSLDWLLFSKRWGSGKSSQAEGDYHWVILKMYIPQPVPRSVTHCDLVLLKHSSPPQGPVLVPSRWLLSYSVLPGCQKGGVGVSLKAQERQAPYFQLLCLAPPYSKQLDAVISGKVLLSPLKPSAGTCL